MQRKPIMQNNYFNNSEAGPLADYLEAEIAEYMAENEGVVPNGTVLSFMIDNGLDQIRGA